MHYEYKFLDAEKALLRKADDLTEIKARFKGKFDAEKDEIKAMLDAEKDEIKGKFDAEKAEIKAKLAAEKAEKAKNEAKEAHAVEVYVAGARAEEEAWLEKMCA